jgi:hypothetical protein
MSYRRRWSALALGGAALLLAREAGAQASTSPSTAQPASGANATGGGGCAHSLDEFDRLQRFDHSPELRRDRGKCHESLGEPFPAIDDYRAYLTARPNASDADAIRTRLDGLEKQVGIVKEGSKGSGSSSSELEMTVPSAGESDSGQDSSLERVEHSEQLDLQADASPLRRGRGLELALSLDPEGYGSSLLGFAFVAGLDLRYSFSAVSTVLFQVNYEHANSTDSDVALGGPGLRIGYEARLALNTRVSDALLLGLTLGYEDLAQGSSGVVYTDVEPRGHFGYRHVFGPSFGLEEAVDGGLALLFPNDDSGNVTTVVIGGHVALVLGF